jgi:hypothetical protein
MTCEIRTTAPTTDEVERGIYIDFEGRVGRRPALLGVFDPEADTEMQVRQIVLEPGLAPAATASDLEVAGIERQVEALVALAERDGRPLIGWSSREPHAVRDHCSPELAARFEASYRDARKAARSWRRRTGRQLPASSTVRGHALSRYARLIGYEASSSLWGIGSARIIADLEDAFGRGATWDQLGRGNARWRRKGRWTRMLRHNELDCRATYEVARVATARG